ncbi:hypothetical protein BDV96DRAFT_597306 [Lophiotrema nucula]|uniref:DUF7918 domain-containing protein n=1 Tax=Lophiotrema nucula TaxID=690887 RepID=A0A6A5ZJ76_9PLEO|nr:hypothetical protein BDV96DRAFT_597306 [Lophiotrema nucula]
MPTLSNLECSIELAQSHQKLQEYGTSYGDKVVETYVAVPSEGQPFAVHLTSNDFIAEGLAMYVFIDGKYQCNRNRQDLVRPTDVSKPLGRRNLVDFRVRQKEERHSKGTMVAREWTFSRLNVVSADKSLGLPDHVLNSIGCIEVVVVRCAGSRNATSARPRPRLGFDGTADIGDHHFGLDGPAREYGDRDHQLHNQQRPLGHPSSHQPPFRSHGGLPTGYGNARHFDAPQTTAADGRPAGSIPHRHSQTYHEHEYPHHTRPGNTSILLPGHAYGPGSIPRDAKYESQRELFHQRTPDRIPPHESLGVSDFVARITREAYQRAEEDIRQKVEMERQRAAHMPIEHGGPRRDVHQSLPGAWPPTPFVSNQDRNSHTQHSSQWGPNMNQGAVHSTQAPLHGQPTPHQVPNQPGVWADPAGQGHWTHGSRASDPWTADKGSSWSTGGLDGWNIITPQQQPPNRTGASPVTSLPPAPFFSNQVLPPTNNVSSSHTGRTDALYNRARSPPRWGSEDGSGWRSDDDENTWPDSSSTWTRSEHTAIPPIPRPLINRPQPKGRYDQASQKPRAKHEAKQDYFNWKVASENGWTTYDNHDKMSVAASGWTNDTAKPIERPTPPVPQYGAALPERLRRRLGRPPTLSPPPYPVTPGLAQTLSKNSGSRGSSASGASNATAKPSSEFNGWGNGVDTWSASRDKENDNLSHGWGDGDAGAKQNVSQARQENSGGGDNWSQNSWGDDKTNGMPGSWDNSDSKVEVKDSSQPQNSAADGWGANDDSNNNGGQEDNGWTTADDNKQDSVCPQYASNEQPAEDSWGGNDGWNNQDSSTSKKSKSSKAKQNGSDAGAWGADNNNAGDQGWGNAFDTGGDEQNTSKNGNNDQGDVLGQAANNEGGKDDNNGGWPNLDTNKESNNQKKDDSAGGGWQNQNKSADQSNNTGGSNGWSNDAASGDNSWDKQNNDTGDNNNDSNDWTNGDNANQDTAQQPDNSWGENDTSGQDQAWGNDTSNQQDNSWGQDASSAQQGQAWDNDTSNQQDNSLGDNAASGQQNKAWGNDNSNQQGDSWPKNDQSQVKAASWNNDGGADNQSVASTSKSRLRNYHRLRKPAHLQPQPHWNFPPPPPGRLATIPEDSESVASGVAPRIRKFKEAPLLAIPESKAKEQCLDHQVQEGKGIQYEHCIGRPEYLDTLEKPYAVFRFRYRSQAMLHKLFPDEVPAPGQEPPESASVFQHRISTMTKDELKVLLTQSWQKKQGSGAHDRVQGWVAEQSKKGSKAPSAAHGSVTGQQKPASNNGADWGNTGWDQANNAQTAISKAPSAAKSATQKAQSNKVASNAGGGWGDTAWGQDNNAKKATSKAPSAANALTEKDKSTKAASNSGAWGQDAFATNNNGGSWDNGNASNKSGSKKTKSQGGWGNGGFSNNDQGGGWNDNNGGDAGNGGGDTWGQDMKTKDLTPPPSIKGDWAGGQEATANVGW